MQDEISSIDQIDITIVPFVSIYRPIRVNECNDTGMKKQNDVMEIKVIMNEFLIKRMECLNSIIEQISHDGCAFKN